MGRSFDDEYVKLVEDAFSEDTQASCDRRKREALERASPSAPRRNFADILNNSERQRAASAGGIDAVVKVRDAYGPQNPWKNQVRPRSSFDFSSSDPGNLPGNYGTWEEGSAQGRAGRVGDAEGSLRSADARARDHWSSGRVESVPTDWMLAEAKRLIAAVRARTYGRKPV